MTPPALTQTWAMHRIAAHMSWIAGARGDQAAATSYEGEAAKIVDAFHARFYNPSTGLYGAGDQASQALALEEDMVPAELRQQVLDRLVTMIRSANDHVVVPSSSSDRAATASPLRWADRRGFTVVARRRADQGSEACNSRVSSVSPPPPGS